MVFTRKNPPPGYYIYLYLRKDGTPYYCGKGINKRAWAKNHSVFVPKDNSRIIFPAWDLSELWALALERKFIRWYGRKDINYNMLLDPAGPGILRNRTDGGEGAIGVKSKRTSADFTVKWRQNISESKTGKKTWNKGISVPEEQKVRQSVTRKSKNGLPGFNIRPACKPESAKASSEKQKGRKFIYNPSTNECKPVAPVELENYFLLGWKLGQGKKNLGLPIIL
jgi:hypothetical protein